MSAPRIVAVVSPHERERALQILGADVRVAVAGSDRFLGLRFDLVLRTTPADERAGSPLGEWERTALRPRLTAHCRHITADLESLAAILGACRTAAPWVLAGAAPRRAA